MKRITVAITLADDGYQSPRDLRGIKAAMVNAAVHKATDVDASIAAIEAKVGTVRKVS